MLFPSLKATVFCCRCHFKGVKIAQNRRMIIIIPGNNDNKIPMYLGSNFRGFSSLWALMLWIMFSGMIVIAKSEFQKGDGVGG